MAHHAEAAQRKLDELEEKCKILRQHNLLAFIDIKAQNTQLHKRNKALEDQVLELVKERDRDLLQQTVATNKRIKKEKSLEKEQRDKMAALGKELKETETEFDTYKAKSQKLLNSAQEEVATLKAKLESTERALGNSKQCLQSERNHNSTLRHQVKDLEKELPSTDSKNTANIDLHPTSRLPRPSTPDQKRKRPSVTQSPEGDRTFSSVCESSQPRTPDSRSTLRRVSADQASTSPVGTMRSFSTGSMLRPPSGPTRSMPILAGPSSIPLFHAPLFPRISSSRPLTHQARFASITDPEFLRLLQLGEITSEQVPEGYHLVSTVSPVLIWYRSNLSNNVTAYQKEPRHWCGDARGDCQPWKNVPQQWGR
ncbi:unnamed protein product [Sphagnum balticum]